MDDLAPVLHGRIPAFLAGGGELGTRIADMDWSATLGPIEAWSDSLAAAAGMIVHCAVPMVLLWGEDGIMLYNDAFSAFAGGGHLAILGMAVRDGVPRIAAFDDTDFIDRIMRVGLEGGSLAYRDQELTLHRDGRPEPIWVNLDTSAVFEASGHPAGVLAIVVETTHRVRAERAQIRAETQVSQMLQSMAEGFLLLDRDFRVLAVNDEALRHTRRRREQVVGLTHWEAWPDLCGDELDRSLRRAMIERAPLHLEHRAVWPDGSASWLEARAYPSGDGLAVFYRDVTRRKRGEDRKSALLALGARLRDLKQPDRIAQAAGATVGQMLGVAHAAYALVQSDGAAVAMLEPWRNDQGAAQAGMRPLAGFIAEAARLHRDASLAVEDVAASEVTHAWRDLFPQAGIAAFASIPLLEAGRVVGLLCVGHDRPRRWPEEDLAFLRSVADRAWAALQTAAAEADLLALNLALEREVEDRTAERDRIWRNSRDLLIAIDRDGLFRAINPAWTAILGHAPGEVVGRSFLDFIHPDDAQLRRDPTGFENRYRHQDGSLRWISWRTSAEGEMVYAYGRDVTAEKQAAAALARTEEQLRQSQKMEAVGQLTGGIAHDFNNMLTGITGSLEMLRARLAQGRTDELDRYIATAEGAARRAAVLTQRLLTFSRRQTLAPRPTAIDRLIAGMEELLRRALGPAVVFAVVAPTDLWTSLVDPNQLENALLNLCINARDAMPQGGGLTIRTVNTCLGERLAGDYDLQAGDYVCVSVTDTGTGMTPEVIARGFDPFFTTKPPGEGTGLGLSMVYGFTRQSGGHVHIVSAVGEGTTICLYLPRFGAGGLPDQPV